MKTHEQGYRIDGFVVGDDESDDSLEVLAGDNWSTCGSFDWDLASDAASEAPDLAKDGNVLRTSAKKANKPLTPGSQKMNRPYEETLENVPLEFLDLENSKSKAENDPTLEDLIGEESDRAEAEDESEYVMSSSETSLSDYGRTAPKRRRKGKTSPAAAAGAKKAKASAGLPKTAAHSQLGDKESKSTGKTCSSDDASLAPRTAYTQQYNKLKRAFALVDEGACDEGDRHAKNLKS